MLPKPQRSPAKRNTDHMWHRERIRLESARHAQEHQPSASKLYITALDMMRGMNFMDDVLHKGNSIN